MRRSLAFAWRRILDVALSTDPQRRVPMSMALLALLIMASSAGVLLLLAEANETMNVTSVRWWAGLSVAGLLVLTLLVRFDQAAKLGDPSLTVPQMVWAITSGAVAYVLAGEARGIVPSLLAMILFFGAFALTTGEVIGIGIYALAAFGCAIAVCARLSASTSAYIETAYALMVLIVLGGCVALNLRIQRIRLKLQRQREALAEALAVNRELATRDELTGLVNRRAMQDLMALEQRRALRTGRPLMLAQLDIDHFKPINDTHGHATGDRALQAFAGTVRACVRDTDVLARWGGEEFVLMLAETTPEDARDLLERVRHEVEAVAIPHASGVLRLTVSAGLAQHRPDDSIDHTLERADQALYTAKALGRNRVALAPPSKPAVGTSALA
jgi:diguanylate cyclase (GGDEF)-like protein